MSRRRPGRGQSQVSGEVLREPMFAKYWTASTISSLGTAATTVALPVLVVRQLSASNFEVGLVNAAQLLPYLVLGLLAGVFIDRWRRRTLLIWTSAGRAVLLALVPAFWASGLLTLPLLIVILIGFGCLNVFAVAGTQSFLPAVVSHPQLFRANARLDQSDAAAQTLGPAAGGALVAALGAPLILLVDAASYVLDAVLIGRIKVPEPPRARDRNSAGVRSEIKAGVAWTYRHTTLAPLSVSTHVWFFGNSVTLTVLMPFALRQLGLSSLAFGLLFAVLGAATLAGAVLAPRAGNLLGVGRTIVICRAGHTLPLIVIGVISSPGISRPAAIAALFIALGAWGIIGGIENPNEMGFRQTITPAEFLGRVNSTVRSANRTCALVGALVGGAVAGAYGFQAAFFLSAAVFGGAFVIAVVTPLRSARIDTSSEPSDAGKHVSAAG
jgi:MFS family permease